MEIKNQKLNNGFTLVEMMISISLFTVVMIVGVGAVLGVNDTLRKTRVTRAAMDTMSFIMEDISRTARLGDVFRCDDFNDENDPPSNIEVHNSGVDCNLFMYEPYTDITIPVDGDPEDQRMYWITEIEDSNGINRGVIMKAPEGVVPDSLDDWLLLTPPELDIDVDRSGFDVYGAEIEDGIQPFVVIRLAGEVALGDKVKTSFALQTVVTQRLLQVPPAPDDSGDTGG